MVQVSDLFRGHVLNGAQPLGRASTCEFGRGNSGLVLVEDRQFDGHRRAEGAFTTGQAPEVAPPAEAERDRPPHQRAFQTDLHRLLFHFGMRHRHVEPIVQRGLQGSFQRRRVRGQRRGNDVGLSGFTHEVRGVRQGQYLRQPIRRARLRLFRGVHGHEAFGFLRDRVLHLVRIGQAVRRADTQSLRGLAAQVVESAVDVQQPADGNDGVPRFGTVKRRAHDVQRGAIFGLARGNGGHPLPPRELPQIGQPAGEARCRIGRVDGEHHGRVERRIPRQPGLREFRGGYAQAVEFGLECRVRQDGDPRRVVARQAVLCECQRLLRGALRVVRRPMPGRIGLAALRAETIDFRDVRVDPHRGTPASRGGQEQTGQQRPDAPHQMRSPLRGYDQGASGERGS